MGTIECSQLAFKSSWDSQHFGDISMVLKMAHIRKSTGPRWVKLVDKMCKYEMDPAILWKIQSGHNSFYSRTDKWTEEETDGQSETSIPPSTSLAGV